MTTYEEDIVEVYYNLKGYFTRKNIAFSATVKRPGGRGRGEIDLLAIKPDKNGRIEDAIRVEVSVSAKSFFPFTDKNGSADEIKRLLKKFFLCDVNKKLKELLGNFKSIRNIMVSSDFNNKTIEKIERRLKEEKVKSFNIKDLNESIELDICHGSKKDKFEYRRLKITIIPFSKIIEELKEKFRDDLMDKSFQDPRLRGLQHLFKAQKKKW